MESPLLDHSSCLAKQKEILQLLFPENWTQDSLYSTLLTIGAKTEAFDTDKITEDYLVVGCQSDLYLYEHYQDGYLFFFTHTEALISSGLATVLTKIYSGETPSTILTCKPLFLDTLHQNLSLSRRHGIEAILLRMKQISVQYLKLSSN